LVLEKHVTRRSSQSVEFHFPFLAIGINQSYSRFCSSPFSSLLRT
jgi:hypothetical protein